MRNSSTLGAVALALLGTAALGSGDQASRDGATASAERPPAEVHLVATYEYPGFKVAQFNLPVLSQYSYILDSNGEALIIDPVRDTDAYRAYLQRNGLTARGVFLTHSHADFVAGHMELAHALEIPVYKHAPADFKFQPVADGATLKIGAAVVRFVETPGHTPDGTCAYALGTADAEHPAAIFTGDTLFVGSIGRPDLLEGTLSAAALASMAYDSWNNKLAKAGDSAVVFPAHGAGSLCGAKLGDEPYSTIGAEKKNNPYVQRRGRAEFVAAVLAGLPEAPQYFRHNAALNRKGPELVDWAAARPEVTSSAELTDPAKAIVVDIRPALAYAAGHIPNSLNIGLPERLETWIGIMVPWEARLVLVGAPEELKQALRRLPRVGYQAATLTWENWTKAGLPVAKSGIRSPAEIAGTVQTTAPLLVDVRAASEWDEHRVDAAVNLPLQHLEELASKLDPNQPLVTLCNTGYRSSMAIGVLERRGFRQVASLDGGIFAWEDAGLPTVSATAAACPTPAAGGPPPESSEAAAHAAGAATNLRLPERIGTAELKALIKDLPGTFELIDVRPAEQFGDYAIPGARNVKIADVLAGGVQLSGDTPLVIVDRDGTLAMMVAGILSQKTGRPVRALVGGLEAWWEMDELRAAVREVDLPALPAAAAAQPAAPAAAKTAAPPRGAAPASQPADPPAAKPARKRSAGC